MKASQARTDTAGCLMPEVAEGGRPLLRLSVRPSGCCLVDKRTNTTPPHRPHPHPCTRPSGVPRLSVASITENHGKKKPASRSRTSNPVVYTQACGCNSDTRRSSAHNASLHCLSTPMHLTHLAHDCACSSSYCCFGFQQGVCTVLCSSIMLKTNANHYEF